MSKRIKATAIGVAFSLGGVVLWTLFNFAGFISGIAGAATGILFLFGYVKFNTDDKSKYPHIVASVVMIADSFLAEVIIVLIMAAKQRISFKDILSLSDNQDMITVDLIIGLLLSFSAYFGYLFSSRRREKRAGNFSNTADGQNTEKGKEAVSQAENQSADDTADLTDKQELK
jgi:hypothetical protein